MLVTLEHMRPSADSALFRSLNPDDWMWADPVASLVAELASIESSRRYFDLAKIMEDVPSEYWPATYGPISNSEKAPSSEDDDPHEKALRAKAAAAELRAELVA